MLARSNPDYADIWRDRYERACRDYQAGGSVHVFAADLFSLGYVGARLQDEIRYQDTLKPQVEREPVRADGFVSGLPR